MAIRVQSTAFDPGAEVNAMHAANVGVGAVVSFVGYVRDFNDGLEVAGMFLEHYPGMTEKALGKIAIEARAALAVAQAGSAASHRRPGAGRADRLRRRRQRPPPGGVRRLRLCHGLPENPRAVLEEREHQRWCALGGRARQ